MLLKRICSSIVSSCIVRRLYILYYHAREKLIIMNSWMNAWMYIIKYIYIYINSIQKSSRMMIRARNSDIYIYVYMFRNIDINIYINQRTIEDKNYEEGQDHWLRWRHSGVDSRSRLAISVLLRIDHAWRDTILTNQIPVLLCSSYHWSRCESRYVKSSGKERKSRVNSLSSEAIQSSFFFCVATEMSFMAPPMRKMMDRFRPLWRGSV